MLNVSKRRKRTKPIAVSSLPKSFHLTESEISYLHSFFKMKNKDVVKKSDVYCGPTRATYACVAEVALNKMVEIGLALRLSENKWKLI